MKSNKSKGDAAMNIRVKVEFADNDKGRYAYVTDEHSASSYGRAVVVMGDEAYSMLDLAAMGATIVTADRELVAQLSKDGYNVRRSDPQAAWKKKHFRVVSTRVALAKYEQLQQYCSRRGITVNAAMITAIDRMIEGEDTQE